MWRETVGPWLDAASEVEPEVVPGWIDSADIKTNQGKITTLEPFAFWGFFFFCFFFCILVDTSMDDA